MPEIVTELINKYGSYGLLFGFIAWLWKSRDDLKTRNASLEAKAGSIEERNSDFKKDSISQMEKLKAENLALQKTIQEKYSGEAILAKYEIKDFGVAIHNENKRAYCLGCLMSTPRKEVALIDNDSYWDCPVQREKHDRPNKPEATHRRYPPYGLTE